MIRARSFVFHLVGIRDCLMHMLCCHDLVLPNIPSMPAGSKCFAREKLPSLGTWVVVEYNVVQYNMHVIQHEQS